MSDRGFLIQRYCTEMHPFVMGRRPFIVSGPRFDSWTVPGTQRSGHQLRAGITGLVHRLFPPGGTHQQGYQLQALSITLLSEEVLSALWCADMPGCLPEELRWNESVLQVQRELWDPSVTIESALAELLSGMGTAGAAQAYLAEDGIALRPIRVPSEHISPVFWR